MTSHPVERRSFLKVSAAAALAGPGAASAAPAAPARKATAKRVIFLFMSGGPGQLDTFDVKEAADTSMVGSIPTAVPGVRVGELFPKFAASAVKRAAVLRSLQTKVPDHALGRYYSHTGYRATAGVTHPSVGAVVAKELADPDSAVPGFVQVGPVFGKVDGDEAVSRYTSYGGGYLGPLYHPLVVKDPAKGLEDLKPLVGPDQFADRLALLDASQDEFRAERGQPVPDAQAVAVRRAVRLMRAREAAAFDLSKEPPKVRQSYGNTGFGDACVLARRLVEAGVTFVEVGLTGWDTHGNALARHQILCADVDPALSALVADLDARGLLDSTLVVWVGEMGRTTPKGKGDKPRGTDHWGKAMAGLLIGGGVTGGAVVGRTDAKGQDVTDRPASVQDLHATIYTALGIDYSQEYPGPGGRPMPVVNNQTEPEPKPLTEVLS